LITSKDDHRNIKYKITALIATVVVAFIMTFFVGDRLVANVAPFISVGILALLTLITLFTMRSKLHVKSIVVAMLWSSAALIMLAIEVKWTPPDIAGSHYLTTGTLAIDQAIERVKVLDPDHNYRVLFDGDIDKQKAAMLASYRGVRTFNSYFNPAPRSQFEELYYHSPRSDNYYRFLGAKYLICLECVAESLHGYEYLESVAGYEIYEARGVLPRNYIAYQVNGEFLNLPDFINKAAQIDLDTNPLFIEPGSIGELDDAKLTTDDCIVREDVRKTNRFRYLIQCNSPGVFILNEFFDNAWRSTVNGVNTQLLKVNGNQIGIPFLHGSHIIEFRYLPSIFTMVDCFAYS
jgi:hypothetical protein